MKKKEKRSDFYAFLQSLIAEKKDNREALQYELENLLYNFAKQRKEEDKERWIKFSFLESFLKNNNKSFLKFSEEIDNLFKGRKTTTFVKYLYPKFKKKPVGERDSWKVNFTFAEIAFFLIMEILVTNYLRNENSLQGCLLPLGERIFNIFSKEHLDFYEESAGSETMLSAKVIVALLFLVFL